MLESTSDDLFLVRTGKIVLIKVGVISTTMDILIYCVQGILVLAKDLEIIYKTVPDIAVYGKI